MSYTKIWVHAVWGIRGRQPVLSNGLRQKFLDHMKEHATEKNIEVGLLNCWIDHVHCLIRLKPEQNVAEVLKLLKGEASKWINENHFTEKKFSWAREYFVASVSEGNLKGVRNYILYQERQHAHRTFREEVAAYFEANPLPEQAVSYQDTENKEHV